MPELFGRVWKATVGALEVSGQRLVFTVTKTLKPQPNKCELQVYNLAKDSQVFTKDIPIQLEAGYKDVSGVIFSGTVRAAVTIRQGPDLITTFGSGDGEAALKTARVNVSMAKGAKVDDALKRIVAALGVAPGNVSSAVVKLKLAGLGTLFQQGTVLHGSAAREMTSLCRSCGLEWSVQNGALQLLPIGQALEGEALFLSPSTGLIGTPTLDAKGVLSCQSLMVQNAFPGRKLVIESELISGQFKVEETEHKGDTKSNVWGVSFKAKAY